MSDRSVAIKGGFWMTVSTIATMVGQFLRLVILTRYLDKSDFGIVSIVNLVIGICIIFTDLGFASSIMYKQDISKNEFSTLYWLQLLLYLIIYAILLAFTPLVSCFYDEKILNSLIPLAGLTLLIQAIGKLYDSILQKHFQFKQLAIISVITNLSSLFVSWILAAKGFGAYSLILSSLLQIFILNICTFILGYKLQAVVLKIRLKESIPLVKIGFYQTGTRIFDYFAYKLDVLIIGKLLGVDVLGLYDLAKELVVKFVSLIGTIVTKVALPILSNNNANDNLVKLRFLQITKTVAIISIPLCIALAVFSKEIVLIIYGTNYIDTAGIVTIFAFVSMISSISCFIDMLGISKGRTDLNFYNTIFRISITIPIVIVTSMISIYAVACGQLLASAISFFACWYIVTMRTYPISLITYFSQFGRYFVGVSVIGLFVALLKNISFIPFSENIVVETMFNASLFIILFCIGAKFLFKEELLFIYKLISNKKNKQSSLT